MEELGYDSVWVCETRTARDAISVMGAIAYATNRIKVGSGVVNSWTRPASLMSLTFATLDELAPDRMLLGIGAYWDPLAWKQGIERRKPVKQMREYIEVTRRLLALETVTYEGELVAVRDLRLDLGHGVARIPKRVPIYVGATGPQMLALSGELADGVMLNGFTSLTYLADALGHIERGARRTGRQVDNLDLPQTIVIAMDEDEEKALEGGHQDDHHVPGPAAPHRPGQRSRSGSARPRAGGHGRLATEGRGHRGGHATGTHRRGPIPDGRRNARPVPGAGRRLLDPAQHLPGTTPDHRELRGDHRGVRTPMISWSPVS